MPRWLIMSAFIVTCEYIVALLIGSRAGYPYRLPFDAYFITFSTAALLIVVAGMLYTLARFAFEGEQHPARRLLAMPKTPVMVFLGLVGLIALQLAVLMWLKVMLPKATGFWADDVLADVDNLLFFGNDPWIISHRLFGWASPLIDDAYATWGPLKTICLLSLIFLPESDTKGRLILSYFLVVSLTAVGQYALPSAGPIFYEHLCLGDRFAALPYQPWAVEARDYLWRDYLIGGGLPGGGISAMPSLHVGLAFWIAMCVTAVLPRLAFLAYAYAAIIVIGSVHLGWHYAVDAIGAGLIVLVSSTLARRLAVQRKDEVVAPGNPVTQ